MDRPFTIRGAATFLLTAAVLLLAASARLRGLLLNTAMLAMGTIAIALPLGAMLGVIIAKVDVPGRRILAWLLAGLLFVPLYVQAAAWNAVLGVGGWVPQALAGDGYAQPWLAGWRGAIWIHAMGAVPWAALMTAASMRTVERRLEEESLLDASPLRVLCRVTLRRGAGGVLAAAVWIAVVCATEIAVTDLFQIRTFAEEIYTEATLGSLTGDASGLLRSDLAVGVALIALLVCLALWLMVPWLPRVAAIAAETTWKWRPVRGRWAVLGVMGLSMALVVFVPLAGLVWKAGIAVHQRDGAFERSWSVAKAATMVAESPWEHRREWGWSLAIGVVAALAAVVIAVLLAWWARVRPGIAKPQAVLIAMGLAAPAPLWGVWVIALLNHPADSVLAPLTTLYDRTLLAPVLVQLVRALPITALWLWSQFTSVPQELLEAARSEGAPWYMQLLRVALPLRLPGLAAAAGIALVLAVSELSATLLVVPPGVTTVSVRIFQLLHYGVDDRVAALALSVFAVMGIGLAVAAVARAVRRSRE
jgi:iron(III) transport system permease protein